MAWARSDGGISAAAGIDDDGHPQRVFWLDGLAGTGKSTIAHTVARRCSDEDRLGASFFFSRGGGELETARMFATTIALQLARRHSLLRTAICDAVRTHPDNAEKLLGDQWRHLVLGPCERLRAAGALLAPLVIVVDALDECKAATEVEFVLELLSKTSAIAEAHLRIFLTSRPEMAVRAGLYSMSEMQRRHVILHHVDKSIVGQDISKFLENTLREFIRKRPFLPGYADGEVIEQLVQRADGLFIWAATACRFIKDGGPLARRRLGVMVKRQSTASAGCPERQLDDIYTNVLRNALRPQFSADEQQRFCCSLNDLLGTIAVLFSSLPAPGLAAMLALSEFEVLDTLCDLHSILDVPSDSGMPIRLQHASVRDFLLGRQRCTDARFWVDERGAHTRIASRCLLFMRETLKKDICGLKDPGVLVNEISRDLIDACMPPPLRYTCLYWVEHVEHVESGVACAVCMHLATQINKIGDGPMAPLEAIS
jgi:hypothetical protein